MFSGVLRDNRAKCFFQSSIFNQKLLILKNNNKKGTAWLSLRKLRGNWLNWVLFVLFFKTVGIVIEWEMLWGEVRFEIYFEGAEIGFSGHSTECDGEEDLRLISSL